jgi:hypothetical protein
MSTIKLTVRQWKTIRQELQTEHPKTVFMLRNKMKQVLGFTVREHNGYRMRTADELAEYDMSDNMWHESESDRKFHRLHKMDNFIALDFYNERKYTMFLLKFSEHLHGTR